MKSLISYLSKLQFNKHFNRVIKAEILEIRNLQEQRKKTAKIFDFTNLHKSQNSHKDSQKIDSGAFLRQRKLFVLSVKKKETLLISFRFRQKFQQSFFSSQVPVQCDVFLLLTKRNILARGARLSTTQIYNTQSSLKIED